MYLNTCKYFLPTIFQVDIDLIDPDGVFQLKAAAGTNAIMAEDDDGMYIYTCLKWPQGRVAVFRDRYQGPFVQSVVSPTSSLRRQLVKYMLTTLSNPLLFFVGKL